MALYNSIFSHEIRVVMVRLGVKKVG